MLLAGICLVPMHEIGVDVGPAKVAGYCVA